MPDSALSTNHELDVDLPGLSAAAEPWFARLSVADQRVQAAPDARIIRYYQTTGLLDRPNRYDGRSARYGERHLLQLVAVRALQSNGLSLAQVQTMLAGATSSELQQVIAGAFGEVAQDGGVENVSVKNSPPPSTSTALTAVELAPGVVVTIDSRIHPDFARTINVLRQALTRANNNAANAPQGDQS
ncbi:MAG: helix-turn-helix domain-containing protein [Gemmatimonadaceae bacterium]